MLRKGRDGFVWSFASFRQSTSRQDCEEELLIQAFEPRTSRVLKAKSRRGAGRVMCAHSPQECRRMNPRSLTDEAYEKAE